MREKWALTKTLAGREQSPITRERDPTKDPARLAWIRTLDCAVKTYPFPGATACRGQVEAHHPTGAGMALKDDDRKAFPFCHGHHIEDFHRVRGAFRGWTKPKLRAWQNRMSKAFARAVRK